jgi:O-antigen biosynthesis protein
MPNGPSYLTSIIISTWNSANYLPRCLASLDVQTIQDFEVIVIDNGSKDGCVDGLEKKWPNLHLYVERWPENRGFAHANNFGVQQASGKWIACLNADAFPEPDWLEQLLKAAENSPEFTFFSSRQINANNPHLLDDAGDMYHVSGLARKRFHDFPADQYGTKQEEVFGASAAAALYAKDTFLQVGGFDDDFFSYYEDVDLSFRLRLYGFRCLYVPQAIVKHIGSASVGSKSEFTVYYWQRNFVWTFIKNMPSALLWKALPAHFIANLVYLGKYILEGRTGAVLRAKIDAFRGIPHFLEKRKDIQRKKEVNLSDLLRIMEQGWFQPYQVEEKEFVFPEEYRSKAWRASLALGNSILALIIRLKINFTNALSYLQDPRRTRILEFKKKYGLVALFKEFVEKNREPKYQLATMSNKSFVEEYFNFNKTQIQTWTEPVAKKHLAEFLASNSSLALPVYDHPLVSIILLFYNRAEMSLQCLESLSAGAGIIPFEVIIVDNASTDHTASLLGHIKNARIIRNTVNQGFGKGCNQAAETAIGRYLLFLNNDAQLFPNCIQVMVDTFRVGKDIGAVGGKLIFPDGKLQEAGSLVWRDGSCVGYGRNDHPFLPEYSYVRDVDYCSGALLMTPRELFMALGKFDQIYEPAYYEDVDYCMQLNTKNYRVVFQPFAVAIHHEFGSSGRAEALSLQYKNRSKFVEKWNQYIQRLEGPGSILKAREHRSNTKRILFIDDQIPDYRLGSGYPRSYKILETLAEMGFRVTFLPLQESTANPEIATPLQLKQIEVMYSVHGEKININAFLKSRSNYYDIVLISRPHNFREAIGAIKKYSKETKIVYDAEAIFALREIRQYEMSGRNISEIDNEKLVQAEVDLANEAEIVITVSEIEKEQFVKHGMPSVHILGHLVEPRPTPATFAERKDILFVGGILGISSPNEDAVRYFVTEIYPLIRQELGCKFYIVGTNQVKAIWDMRSDYIHVIGKVDDLTPYYNQCRLFVVPTRYSAGIPIKLLEAAAHGLPAVVTPLTADQVGWREDYDLLIGRDPLDFSKKVIDLYSDEEIFNTLRKNSLERIRKEYGPERFRKKIEIIISSAG